MRVLALDTSTPRAFVAAVEDGIALRVITSDKPSTHAERLLGMVQDALVGCGWGADRTELVAVGRGPGSFTGVRVGVATAKGWALARGIPLVGVVSLDAMAYSARRLRAGQAGAALIDARKGEVFAALYDPAGERLVEPAHLPRGHVERWLRDAEDRCNQRCGWVVGEVADYLGVPADLLLRSPDTDLPSPVALAALALQRWAASGHDELVELEPLYVRPPDITVPAAKSTPGGGSA